MQYTDQELREIAKRNHQWQAAERIYGLTVMLLAFELGPSVLQKVGTVGFWAYVVAMGILAVAVFMRLVLDRDGESETRPDAQRLDCIWNGWRGGVILIDVATGVAATLRWEAYWYVGLLLVIAIMKRAWLGVDELENS